MWAAKMNRLWQETSPAIKRCPTAKSVRILNIKLLQLSVTCIWLGSMQCTASWQMQSMFIAAFNGKQLEFRFRNQLRKNTKQEVFIIIIKHSPSAAPPSSDIARCRRWPGFCISKLRTTLHISAINRGKSASCSKLIMSLTMSPVSPSPALAIHRQQQATFLAHRSIPVIPKTIVNGIKNLLHDDARRI